MLDIDIENKKGILFVRLYGELSKKTISKWNYDVKDLMIDNGIRNVVFNILSFFISLIKSKNILVKKTKIGETKHKIVNKKCKLFFVIPTPITSIRISKNKQILRKTNFVLKRISHRTF